MKDVSKQTVHNLITYIYRGEIDVNAKDLEEFINTAKALKLSGLTQEHEIQVIHPQPLQTTLASTPTYNGLQYQASQTIRVQNFEDKTTTLDSFQSNYFQALAQGSQQQIDSKLDGTNVVNENGCGAHEHFDMSNGLEDVSMDLEYGDDCNGSWKDDQENSKGEDFIKPNASSTKYTKRIYSKRIWIESFWGE